jgi:hypothetical protein
LSLSRRRLFPSERPVKRPSEKGRRENGICERFQKTVLNEFYQVASRNKIYSSIEELQAGVDVWLKECNEQRPHSGKYCFGKTPMLTFHEETLHLVSGDIVN